MKVPHPSLVALQHRNFRLLWAGLLLSFTGSYMQNAALLWHVSLLAPPDRKGLALGMVGLVRVVPIIAFSMIAGVVADAHNRRRVMFVTQTCAALVAVALAVVTWNGLSALWPIYALAALGGAVGAFDQPARQSLVPTLVPREHLPSAVTLNAIVMQSAAVAGPASGGILIATAGLTWVYFVNALSFGFVIAGLLMMRDLPERLNTGGNDVSWRAAREGLRFVFANPLIRATMLLDFCATFFASALALLPIFAQDILLVGAEGYGWLYAAPAVGAVAMSAAMVLLTHHIKRRGPVLVWAVAIYGLATVAFGFSRFFWLSFACLAISGAADTVSIDHPQPAAAAGDAGPPARPHARREHGLRPRRAGARRARSRRRRQLAGRTDGRDYRRPWLPGDDRLDCGGDARAAPLSRRTGRDDARAVRDHTLATC